MNKKYDFNKTSSVEEINQKVNSAIEKIFGYMDSDAYKAYLKCMSKFHNYSLNNTLLIALQRPDASLVCGTRHGRKIMADRYAKVRKASR